MSAMGPSAHDQLWTSIRRQTNKVHYLDFQPNVVTFDLWTEYIFNANLTSNTNSYLSTLFFQFAKCFYIDVSAHRILLSNYDEWVLFQKKIVKGETLFNNCLMNFKKNKKNNSMFIIYQV